MSIVKTFYNLSLSIDNCESIFPGPSERDAVKHNSTKTLITSFAVGNQEHSIQNKARILLMGIGSGTVELIRMEGQPVINILVKRCSKIVTKLEHLHSGKMPMTPPCIKIMTNPN